jgi:hypothetical protein
MKGKSLAMIALLSLPVAAGAQALSYSNVDFAYLPSAEIDNGAGDIDGDGFLLRGMLPVYDNFFVLAEFESLNYDFDIDTTRFAVGVGGHWPLATNIDIVGRLGVTNYQLDFRGGDDDDTGLFFGGRIRAMITPQFELEGGVDFHQVEVGGVDDQTVIVGEARYHFNSQWSAGLLVNIGSDVSNYGLHGRFSF